jgi:hypothetical protein
MFAKLENSALTIAPKEIDGITDPPDEIYYANGYSRVVFSEMPTDGAYESTWEQNGNTIVQSFIKQDRDDLSASEAFDIIFGGAE